ncbi:ExeA family protein [Roseateles sp. YR242]|uniref:ExeA family protein n=1 Tax=Roseateles sp. YR242 TaxID=1855305 RepID=UPI001160BCE5|nr:ExeA family protein [Roseateles sp. YR242]
MTLQVAAAVRRWLPRPATPSPADVHVTRFSASALPELMSTTSPVSLFMSHQHMEALAHLRYGLDCAGGVVLLTGAIGTGKTAVCRAFLRELPPQVQAFHLARPGSDRKSLMIDICRGFGLHVDPAASERAHIDQLNELLLRNEAQGHRTMLIVDDAQRLSPDLLEQLRLLTNLETDRCKLLQIVLVGQTGLRDLLERPELRQLSQRVVARHHLVPLAREEMVAYAHHKLDASGIAGLRLSRRAAWTLHAWTQGVPRTVDQLLDRAVATTLSRGALTLDASTLARAARNIGLSHMRMPWPWSPQLAGTSLTLVLACAGAVAWIDRGEKSHAAPRPAPAPSLTATPVLLRPVPTQPPPVLIPSATAVSTAAGPEPMVAMLQRWRASSSDWPGCARLPDRLRCLQGRTSLQELLDLDLPVVLHLSDESGRSGDAMFQGIDAGQALLRFDDKSLRIPVEEMKQRWRGDFTAVWSSPPAFSRPLRLGDSGPAVAWIRSSLSRLHGRVGSRVDGTRFDASLQAALRAFQRQEHLDVDGIAGIKSLVRLAQRVDGDSARLAPPASP